MPRDAARAAVLDHSSFNLLDTASGLKVDLFVVGDGALDAMQMERRLQVTLPEIDRPIWVTSPEVQVLRKPDWYVRGGQVSDRQWRDVVSILRITDLDTSFLTAAPADSVSTTSSPTRSIKPKVEQSLGPSDPQ